MKIMTIAIIITIILALIATIIITEIKINKYHDIDRLSPLPFFSSLLLLV